MSNNTYYPKIKAPDFPSDIQWLNTDKSYNLKDFRGKFVLLDFWTYCCINCMHVLPDLKKLEQKYAEELVVIGVHSAKFVGEKESRNIRQAILRYDIEHPVVNDKDFEVWQSYGARAWPTFVLIDPKGYIIGQISGEGIFEPIDETLTEVIPQYSEQLNRERLDFVLEKEKTPETLLKFPGKVLADEKTKRIYITDSNNHRILITDYDGNVVDVIGSGVSGKQNSTFEEASFNNPQGLTLDGKGGLYIADTENHLIRKANLQKRTVETISGVGKQIYDRAPSGEARLQPLNSPWDVIIKDDILYIAMAGPHQIWSIDLPTNTITLHAGSGVENIIDGKLHQSALAQPSGLAIIDSFLYVADSEVSGIREISLNTNGRVNTLIGKGLFDFGDVDGDFDDAFLQHPLGIVAVDETLYVADTYNNKIKLLDLKNREIETYAGTGEEGMQDGKRLEATFDEPAGISYANGKLYIADTNNHLIRVIDTKSGEVTTFTIVMNGQVSKDTKFSATHYKDITTLEPVNFENTKQLQVEITLEDRFERNDGTPSFVIYYNEEGKYIGKQEIITGKNLYPFPEVEDNSKLYIELIFYYCEKTKQKVCLVHRKAYELHNETMDGSPVPVIRSEVKS